MPKKENKNDPGKEAVKTLKTVKRLFKSAHKRLEKIEETLNIED